MKTTSLLSLLVFGLFVIASANASANVVSPSDFQGVYKGSEYAFGIKSAKYDCSVSFDRAADGKVVTRIISELSVDGQALKSVGASIDPSQLAQLLNEKPAPDSCHGEGARHSHCAAFGNDDQLSQIEVKSTLNGRCLSLTTVDEGDMVSCEVNLDGGEQCARPSNN